MKQKYFFTKNHATPVNMLKAFQHTTEGRFKNNNHITLSVNEEISATAAYEVLLLNIST
jgi:hypothetical protein